MKFPWNKYVELPTKHLNTLQVFITNACNLKCEGCFARKIMGNSCEHMSIDEYTKVAHNLAYYKHGEKINLLGGEPLMHPELCRILDINVGLRKYDRDSYWPILSTTIYTNGLLLSKYTKEDFKYAKVRVQR